ncbi:MAG: hypothetical protein AB7S53_12190, partial [Thiomonas sp.]
HVEVQNEVDKSVGIHAVWAESRKRAYERPKTQMLRQKTEPGLSATERYGPTHSLKSILS